MATAGAAIKVWRSEEDGRKLLDAATTEWENSDTVNRPTRLDTQSSSATPANDGQTLSSTDAATATGRPALRAKRESSRPTLRASAAHGSAPCTQIELTSQSAYTARYSLRIRHASACRVCKCLLSVLSWCMHCVFRALEPTPAVYNH